jgi:hypothetical protein
MGTIGILLNRAPALHNFAVAICASLEKENVHCLLQNECSKRQSWGKRKTRLETKRVECKLLGIDYTEPIRKLGRNLDISAVR